VQCMFMFGEQIAGEILNIQRVNESFDKYDRGEIFGNSAEKSQLHI
jgi:hypothetical protein